MKYFHRPVLQLVSDHRELLYIMYYCNFISFDQLQFSYVLERGELNPFQTLCEIPLLCANCKLRYKSIYIHTHTQGGTQLPCCRLATQLGGTQHNHYGKCVSPFLSLIVDIDVDVLRLRNLYPTLPILQFTLIFLEIYGSEIPTSQIWVWNWSSQDRARSWYLVDIGRANTYRSNWVTLSPRFSLIWCNIIYVSIPSIYIYIDRSIR